MSTEHAIPWSLLVEHLRAELLKFVRMRAYLLASVGGPALLFGLSVSNPAVRDIDGLPGRVYLLATYGTFVLFGIALFSVGLSASVERERGVWAALKRSPTPLWVPLAAKVVACALATCAAFTVILFEAFILFGRQVPWERAPLIMGAIVVSSVPLCTMALVVSASFRASAMPMVMTVLYLVLSAISGLVVPMEMLARGGGSLPRLALVWPTYHAGELALAAVRVTSLEKVGGHAAALALFTVIFGVLARLQFRREFTS
jgi:ABC-2 type transport system permease protein